MGLETVKALCTELRAQYPPPILYFSSHRHLLSPLTAADSGKKTVCVSRSLVMLDLVIMLYDKFYVNSSFAFPFIMFVNTPHSGFMQPVE